MKKTALIALIAVIISSLYQQPSHALFGASKCEKAKSQLMQEEKISNALFLKIRSAGKSYRNYDKSDFNSFKGLVKTYEISIINQIKIALKNSSCYPTEKVADLRINYNAEVENLKSINALQNDGITNKFAKDVASSSRTKLIDFLYPKK
jgi:hypothetical protein